MKELRIRKITANKFNRLMAQESVNLRKEHLSPSESNIVRSWRVNFEPGIDAYLDVVLCDTYLLCSVTWYKGDISFQASDTRSKLDGEWICNGNPEFSFKVVVC